MAQTISSQVVPNLTNEIFDVAGTSKSENYAFNSDAGLTNRVETNWRSMGVADEGNFTIYPEINIKTFVEKYDGYPTAVEKLARNISVFKGTTTVSVGLDFSKTWAVINQSSNTKFIRLDNGTELDPTTVDSHTQWGQWWSRFKGSFDAAGFPVGAFESSLTQVSVMKRQGNATYTFNGFSPVMTHSGEALATNIGSQTNNLVFYTKDTTSATDRFARRGSRLFCRIEVELYGTEYPICDFGFSVKAIEHIWFTGGKFYIMVLAGDDTKHTFVSAPYDIVLAEDSAVASILPQSILYSQVVTSANMGTESAVSQILVENVDYFSIVVTRTFDTESSVAEILVQDLDYDDVVEESTIPTESAESDVDAVNIEYFFDPPTPPPVTPEEPPYNYDEPTSPDIIISTYTIQSVTYT